MSAPPRSHDCCDTFTGLGDSDYGLDGHHRNCPNSDGYVDLLEQHRKATARRRWERPEVVQLRREIGEVVAAHWPDLSIETGGSARAHEMIAALMRPLQRFLGVDLDEQACVSVANVAVSTVQGPSNKGPSGDDTP